VQPSGSDNEEGKISLALSVFQKLPVFISIIAQLRTAIHCWNSSKCSSFKVQFFCVLFKFKTLIIYAVKQRWELAASFKIYQSLRKKFSHVFVLFLFNQFLLCTCHTYTDESATCVGLAYTHRPISKSIQYWRLLELKNGTKFCKFSSNIYAYSKTLFATLCWFRAHKAQSKPMVSNHWCRSAKNLECKWNWLFLVLHGTISSLHKILWFLVTLDMVGLNVENCGLTQIRTLSDSSARLMYLNCIFANQIRFQFLRQRPEANKGNFLCHLKLFQIFGSKLQIIKSNFICITVA